MDCHSRGHNRGHVLINPRKNPTSRLPSHKSQAQRDTETFEKEAGDRIALADVRPMEMHIYDTDVFTSLLSQHLESSGHQSPARRDTTFFHSLTFSHKDRYILDAILDTDVYSNNGQPNYLSAAAPPSPEGSEALLTDTSSTSPDPTPIQDDTVGEFLIDEVVETGLQLILKRVQILHNLGTV